MTDEFNVTWDEWDRSGDAETWSLAVGDGLR